MYEGRFVDAVRIFEEGASRDLQEKHAERAADKLIALAHAELARGRKRPAAVAADQALMNNSRMVKTRFMAARVFIDAGEIERAKQLANELAKERLAEPRAYAKILEGEMFLQAGDPARAIASLTVANSADLLDTWIGHFVLGRAYLAAAEIEQTSGNAAEAAGLFAQADSEFDRCLKRRGEALSLFLDQEPTFGLFPPVHYYQGRGREGLGATGFAESYRAYLAIRGESNDDSLARDARRRLGL
jgi:tetratricopeptide (TPR) repeat protein